MSSLPAGAVGVVLLHQFEELLRESKTELSEIRNLLYALNLEDTDELNKHLATVEQAVFDCSLDVCKHLLTHATSPMSAASLETKGVKLPKIDVPTFD